MSDTDVHQLCNIAVVIILYLRNIDYFKDVSAVYAGWVGIAIGYFFDSRQVESMRERIDEIIRNMDIASEDYEKQLKDCEKEANELEDDYNKAVADLQYIVVKYQQNLDKDLLERLKNMLLYLQVQNIAEQLNK